ncbi:acetyltransferase [Vibrio cholerae]|nr:acetyltransferase [Vibrio cholerae]
MQLMCLSLVVMRCQSLRRALCVLSENKTELCS